MEMKRCLISELNDKSGETVFLKGWIERRRDHGKLIFLDLRDRSGEVQCVVIPDALEAYETAKHARGEYIVSICGTVKDRPVSASRDDITGKVEIEVKEMVIFSAPSGELPIDISQLDMNVNLDTLLNYRALTLRNKKVRKIFELYAVVLEAYANFMRSEGFREIKTPKILSSVTEGGANFFKIKYFDREAYLAQSPQFYKQAGVGIFERVFEIGSVFRAEPHFTTRHVNEYIGLDAEMGFIEGIEDVMNILEGSMFAMVRLVEKRCPEICKIYGTEIPKLVSIPRIPLAEAVEILQFEYGKILENMDIDSEGERLIGQYVKKKYDSDFVFLTHYPSHLRPFYSFPSKNSEFTETFDLLFRGLEIASGGQRIHKYGQLVSNIQKHGMNPEDFSSYLDIFRYGMPPHGGFGLGSERIVQQFLGLGSIKEAILFPRDVKRLSP